MVKTKTVLSTILIVLILAALTVFSVACGKQAPAEQQATVTASDAETAAETQAAETETAAKLPHRQPESARLQQVWLWNPPVELTRTECRLAGTLLVLSQHTFLIQQIIQLYLSI